MNQEKPIAWIGSSFDDLMRFPVAARHEAGFQLDKVQHGRNPDNWKPFDDVGVGVREIRITDESGAYRVMYVAKFEEAVYVLHTFQKKTQTTSQRDKEIVMTRYKAVIAKRSKQWK